MKRNTAELKEKLIQSGIKEIQEQGIDKLSLRTVAKACGVTHGSPYKHFESKEEYLKVVLERLSILFNQELTKDLRSDSSAREQLSQMGLQFVTFAQKNPHIFEALFIKYPFNYLTLTEDTILTEVDIPGFDNFKNLIIKLRQEEKLAGHEADTLIHFWSFISGLSILISSHVGEEFSQKVIGQNIDRMLDIYIKGGQA